MAGRLDSVALVGSTGLVVRIGVCHSHYVRPRVNLLKGSHILKTLTSLKSRLAVTAIARKELPANKGSTFTSLIEGDSSKWASLMETMSPPPTALISALGTTRAQAGGLEAQRKIDYDLNLELAVAAQKAGTQIYVLTSSAGSIPVFSYTKMKLDLEQAVSKLDIPYIIILRPALLVGVRQESRPAEAAMRFFAMKMGSVNNILKDFWAVDVDIVAKAAVSATQQCLEGKREKGVWKVEQADIIRLGRTEWKDD